MAYKLLNINYNYILNCTKHINKYKFKIIDKYKNKYKKKSLFINTKNNDKNSSTSSSSITIPILIGIGIVLMNKNKQTNNDQELSKDTNITKLDNNNNPNLQKQEIKVLNNENLKNQEIKEIKVVDNQFEKIPISKDPIKIDDEDDNKNQQIQIDFEKKCLNDIQIVYDKIHIIHNDVNFNKFKNDIDQLRLNIDNQSYLTDPNFIKKIDDINSKQEQYIEKIIEMNHIYDNHNVHYRTILNLNNAKYIKINTQIQEILTIHKIYNINDKIKILNYYAAKLADIQKQKQKQIKHDEIYRIYNDIKNIDNVNNENEKLLNNLITDYISTIKTLSHFNYNKLTQMFNIYNNYYNNKQRIYDLCDLMQKTDIHWENKDYKLIETSIKSILNKYENSHIFEYMNIIKFFTPIIEYIILINKYYTNPNLQNKHRYDKVLLSILDQDMYNRMNIVERLMNQHTDINHENYRHNRHIFYINQIKKIYSNYKIYKNTIDMKILLKQIRDILFIYIFDYPILVNKQQYQISSDIKTYFTKILLIS